mmetsp:Transcript_58185/g.185341  ORF Transcript_58185/g.185341 Transcript_58185/m.185341 type:complete len:244 (+) Transcript_58185:150-881(+)
MVAWLLVSTVVTMAALTVLLLVPHRPDLRISTCNLYGTVFGRGAMWLMGCPVKVMGQQYAGYGERRPAIFIANHASALDIVLCMWLTPMHTIGIAKKEIVFFPVFGLLYLLSGHIRIDRSNRAKAVESMRKAGDIMVDRSLSTMIWPEGTRSPTGRLVEFKKGVVHLAVQTGLPIVPIVLTGTQKAWPKGGGLAIRPVPVSVTFLPPVETVGWNTSTMGQHLAELRELYLQHLPPDQQPLPGQ